MRRAERGVRGRVADRVRALLSLGIVAGLVATTTMATWTDTATMTGGEITSGRLDLMLDSQLSGPEGTWQNASLAMAGMRPGESVAVTVPVQRAAGTVAFSYTGTATASGGLAPHLRWEVRTGTADEATTTDGLRTQSCTGGAVLASAVTLSDTATAVVPVARTLTGTVMSEKLCIRAELPAGSGGAGTSATATFVFDARQVM